MTEKEHIVYQAKLAEQAERYDDMVKFMRAVVVKEGELTDEERNLLSVAYKNVTGARRSSWRILSSLLTKREEKNKENLTVMTDYRDKVEKELEQICEDVLTLLDDHLIASAAENDSKVFYYKMKGDYYRYMAEYADGDRRKDIAEKSLLAYKSASDEANNLEMKSTDPIRLGLALNYSVFYYEILNSPTRAINVAKAAFDDAIAELDSVNEDVYKDATLIMQLLRDNLTLWTSESQEEQDAEGSGNVDDVEDA